MSRLVAFVMAVGILIVAGSISIDESPKDTAKVLFLAREDHADPQLSDSIAAFEQAGYLLTTDLRAARRNASRAEVVSS